MDRLELSQEPIAGEICKTCQHSILMGDQAAGMFARFCGYEENLIEVEDYVEGIRYTYAPLCSACNDGGGCMDYEQAA